MFFAIKPNSTICEKERSTGFTDSHLNISQPKKSMEMKKEEQNRIELPQTLNQETSSSKKKERMSLD